MRSLSDEKHACFDLDRPEKRHLAWHPDCYGTPPMNGKHATAWLKLPGLFFRWEISGLTLGDAARFRVEERGYDDRGVPLFAVYHQPSPTAKETER